MRYFIFLLLIILSTFVEASAQSDTINQLDHIGRRIGLWQWNDIAGKPYRKAWYSEAGEDSSAFIGLNGKPLEDFVLADDLLLNGKISVDSLKQIHHAVMGIIEKQGDLPPEGVGLVVVSFMVDKNGTLSQLRLIQGLTPEINLRVYEAVQQMDKAVFSCCLAGDKPMLVFLPIKF